MNRPLLGWCLAAAFAIGLAGCSGDDGAQGPAGPPGPQGPPGPGAAPPTAAAVGDLSGEITAVSINSATGIATVTFSVRSAAGLPVTGARNFEFTVAKLIPATSNRPAYWQSYINTSRQQSGGVRVLRATGERAPATEVEPGVYRYTLCTSLTAAASFRYYGSGNEPAGSCPTSVVARSGVLDSAAASQVVPGLDLAYAANATTRIAIAGRDSGARYNAVADFVPASLPSLLSVKARQVVTNESCGACHAADSSNRARLAFTFHGGTRHDVALCDTCHNPSTYDSRSSTNAIWTPIDMTTMIHRIHASVPGYSVDGVDYSHVTYPQNAPFGGVSAIGAFTAKPGVLNCRTCHDNQSPKITQPADRPAADRMAWMTNVSQQACNTCHSVDFSNHFGNQPGNAQCALCHAPDRSRPVNVAHATPYSTPNNPELVDGAKKVEYEIASVTLNAANQPTVKFRVKVDGANLNLKSLPSDITSVSSTFVLAWSAPMPAPASPANGPAIAQPLDWNNFGTTTGRQYWNYNINLQTGTTTAATAPFTRAAFDQPRTVGISGIIASLDGPDADGYFTTVPGISATAPVAFPANSTLRGVAIESFLVINGMNISGTAPLRGVDGANTLRRSVVDIDSCNTCHERIGFHGSAGRSNNPDHCAMCHNPEMTSSNVFAGMHSDGKNYSQKPNSFKEMIHSIHAAGVRSTPFNFIRGNVATTAAGQGPHPFEDVGYPARIADCAACHRPNTYNIPNNDRWAWTVVDAQPALGTVATFNPALSVRQGPGAGACGSCHDSSAARAHYAINTAVGFGETCAVCHGPGGIADPAVKHRR